MQDISRILIELKTLKQQVKWLMTRNAGGGVPVKVLGLWDGNYFDSADNQPPEVTSNQDDSGDIYVVDVYLNGLSRDPTGTELALRVPVTQPNQTPPSIPQDRLLFAAPAKSEVTNTDNKIEYYIMETGTITAPCKIVSKINPDPDGGAGAGYRYNVLLYPNGIMNTEVEGICEQLSIDPNETIPANTWVLATQTSDGKWYMQVPVWL